MDGNENKYTCICYITMHMELTRSQTGWNRHEMAGNHLVFADNGWQTSKLRELWNNDNWHYAMENSWFTIAEKLCHKKLGHYNILHQPKLKAIINKHHKCFTWLIKLCFMMLSTLFPSFHRHSSHDFGLSWVSPELDQGSELSCQKTILWKNPVRLEPRTHGLWVKTLWAKLDSS